MFNLCVENLSSGDLIFAHQQRNTQVPQSLGRVWGMEVSWLYFLSISSTCQCCPVNPWRFFKRLRASLSTWTLRISDVLGVLAVRGLRNMPGGLASVSTSQLRAAFWGNKHRFYLISTVCVAGWKLVKTNLEIFYCTMWGIELRGNPDTIYSWKSQDFLMNYIQNAIN